MSALKLHLTEIQRRTHIRRQYALQALRDYIKVSSDIQLIRQIKMITSLEQLKILWEAGLKAPLQRAVSIRIEELTTRRGE